MYQEIVKEICPCQYQVFGFLHMYNNSNRKKWFHSIEVTCFLIFDKKTRILNAFMTTKTMQIYLYIGVNQLYGNDLKIFSLPTHVSFIKKFMKLCIYLSNNWNQQLPTLTTDFNSDSNHFFCEFILHCSVCTVMSIS